ncbi:MULTISPECIES: DUF433 domain-containing protein [Bradyrhizobium]
MPVRSIKSFAEGGVSGADIRKKYPTVTENAIRAAIAHKDVAA